MNVILAILISFSVVVPVVMIRLIHRETSQRNAEEEQLITFYKSVDGYLNPQRLDRFREIRMRTDGDCTLLMSGFIVFSQEKPSVIGGEYIILIDGHPCACLKEGLTVFGRDEETDVSIQDSSVSRIHFSILVKNQQAFITDLGSSNGTYIDGERVSREREIYDGDVIKAGGINLSFAMV